MAGILDVLFSRAPAAIASGLKGQREGREYQDEIKRRAMQDSLAERRTAVAEEGQATKNELADLRGRLDPERLKGYLQQVYQSDPKRAAQGRVEGEVTGRVDMGLTPEPRRNIDPNAPETLAARYAHEREMELLRQRGRNDGTPKPKGLPASSAEKLSMWKTLQDAARGAQQAMTVEAIGDANPTGFFANQARKVGAKIGGPLTPKPQSIRAASRLANVNTALGQMRSGGAIPTDEYDRLLGMLPDPNEDESVIRTKLEELDAYLSNVIRRQVEGFTEAHYDMPGGAAGKHTSNFAVEGRAPVVGGEDRAARAARLLAEVRGGKP